MASFRRSSQLTQAELAEKVGVTVETISRLERGSSIPSIARLADVAHALDVSLHELFVPDPTAAARHAALGALVDDLRRSHPDEIRLVRDLARCVHGHVAPRRVHKRRQR